jgi:hypothetical protein
VIHVVAAGVITRHRASGVDALGSGPLTRAGAGLEDIEGLDSTIAIAHRTMGQIVRVCVVGCNFTCVIELAETSIHAALTHYPCSSLTCLGSQVSGPYNHRNAVADANMTAL